jgi:hypothetical protein
VIAKIPPKRKDGKSSFRELIDYIRGKDGERAIHVGFQGISSPESAAVEMESVAFTNVRCKDPVFHFILSWRELEYPTNEQTDEAVKIALTELDLQNCQALWALQGDTENRHVHVAVNRIDPETGKAIQPAGNWTYKALERAARKIETTQGWEVLKEGRYEVTPDREIHEKMPDGQGEEKISQAARDIEAHTATKSGERIGKEIAAPIIQAAKSWEELHEKLGERGIFFERKGSGAILKIGGAVIKASQVSRDMSLSKLEARLGEYRASNNLEKTQEAPVEPVERANQPKVRGNWEEYVKTRTAYFENKKKANTVFQARQKQERALLQKKQKAERARLFTESWKGRGRELNQRRSVMAAMQQAEKLNLRDRQKKEREKLVGSFPHRFPNFKTWLDREANPELSMLFRYPDDPVMLGADLASGFGTPQFADLRAFTAIFGNKGGVGYCRKEKGGTQKPDFVDYGKKILLSRNCDETAVLAALQLASQKWGTVQISGTESYKKLCAEVAAKHNIRISVMGAPKSTTSLSPEERKVKDIEESRSIFERYAKAVGAERFRVVVTDFSQTDGTRAFVFDKKIDGLEGKTLEGILEALSKLRQYEHYGKNINVVPLSPDKHHILIDDMNAENLERLKQDGYRPACVIESSPGNFQAILTVPKLEISLERGGHIGTGPPHEAANRGSANALTKDLNLRYGDPKLSGAIHAHRLPPFANCKPKHRQEDGTYPATRLLEAEGGICEKAAAELMRAHERITREAEEVKKREREHRTWSASFARNDGATDPNGAYRAHWRDVLEKIQGDVDYSRVDAMTGLRMRVTGYSAGQICEAIRENAPVMRKEVMSDREYAEKYRYRNWERYAKETTEKYVFGPRGAGQYCKSEEYQPYYMKLEGRALAGSEPKRELSR